MFDEKLLEAVNEDFTHLNKVMVESTAQTAYNSVVFEAALEDVLAEADDAEAEEKKDADPSKVKNNLYKAWEAVKKFFVSICQKIRVAINEFIAKASQKNFKKAIEDYNKNNADADSKVKPAKFLGIENPMDVFGFVKGIGQYISMGEDAAVKAIAGDVAKALGGNYADAKKALGAAEKFADINKVLLNLVSYAQVNEKAAFTIDEFMKSVPDLTEASAAVKARFSELTSNGNKAINDLKASINAAATADEVAAIKAEIAIANKLLATVHAAFIGYMKWAVASNSAAITALKSAKKGGVKESADMTFMGLALI